MKKTVDTVKVWCYDGPRIFEMRRSFPAMMNLFAAYFFSYFYFFGFSADKVKVLFAANNGMTAFA